MTTNDKTQTVSFTLLDQAMNEHAAGRVASALALTEAAADRTQSHDLYIPQAMNSLRRMGTRATALRFVRLALRDAGIDWTPTEVESLHYEVADLAGMIEATCNSACDNIDDCDPEMIADFIFDNDEPDEHGRILSGEYRPMIIATARIVFAQMRAALEDIEA